MVGRPGSGMVISVLMKLTVCGFFCLAWLPLGASVAAAQESGSTPLLSVPPAIGEMASNAADRLQAAGYVQREFFLEGVARSYEKRGDWDSNGFWNTAPGEAAAYKIRLFARYPEQVSRFNGIVFVEWLNVSGGGPGADVNFTQLHEELLRDGYAYIGVGAQAVGVAGLKRGSGAQRYASLSHPGDSYSYDIYSQAGRILRSSEGLAPLGPLTERIRYLLADGQSQSAGRLVTYVNALHPIARVYDGFFIHSRSGGGAALAQDAENTRTVRVPAPARLRTDLDVPVFVIEAEGDVPRFMAARQPDTPQLRIWEVAGAAHADRYQLTAGGLRPMQINCDDEADPRLSVPVNDGAMTYSLRAALRHMKQWIAGGAPPPSAPPLVTDGNTIRRDPATNIALGGVRTPQVDVPTRTLHGVRAPAGGPGFCRLFGRTDEWNGDTDPWDGGPGDPSPTPEPVLSRLYPTTADYMAQFERALEAGIKAGFLVKEDTAALRAEAARVRID